MSTTTQQISFKLTNTELTQSLNIDTAWSMTHFINYVKNNIFYGDNLGNIDIVDDTWRLPNQRAEDCLPIYPDTVQTVHNKYGNSLHSVAFYIRQNHQQNANANTNANTNANAVAITVQPEQQYLPEYRQCVICLSQERNLVFSPCHHLCTCADCGSNQTLSSCPICRATIQSRQVIYV